MNRRRFGLLMVLAAMSLVFASPPAALAYDYSYARVVRLSLIEGDVQVSRPDAQGWEQAVVNLPIQQGYSLATGRGRAEIEFESGATARLADNSILQFTELALSSGGRITKLTLTQGTATFFANLSREDSFVVATPQLQVVIPENARFRLDVSDDTSSVSVLKGGVEVDSRAGTRRLTKGHTLAYRASDPDQVTLDRNPKSDDWDHWVADRDEVIHSGDTASLRYVNSPYTYGLSDLYDYGSWYNIAGYGQCWRPYGLSFGWSPYWNGTWAFYPGLGWTWLSFEPWGWLPYHFGSWFFSPSLGWLWVPGFSNPWQPALVTWVRVGNRVGWVPLAPRDQPGQMPTNLQHGVVVNTSNGFIGPKHHERLTLGSNERAQLLSGPPASFTAALASTPNAIRSSTLPAGVPTRSRDRQSSVFERGQHKFVNNPAGPARTQANPTPQGSSRTATPSTSSAPAQPPATRERNAPPHQTPSAPRSSPPAPRTQKPQARSESFRPAPVVRWESAPRPSSPPVVPRSEPRATVGSRPHN